MKLTDYNFPEKELKFGNLLPVMDELGFVHAEQWDYERVMFDYKMLDDRVNATYYLRVPAYAVEGDIPGEDTIVKLMTPIVGRHYYPHGVEYDEEMPSKVLNKCATKLKGIEEGLKGF
ncbi:YugN family protein [Geomicrobium sp. JCM 19039]|uniref:YugN family protein n=1 Tax=Geomicrobium sp. JCM 19039 TaxID=1460636 RepID=UPI00045F4C68|nr:YugN family protein [Geomicrobium sp. JCM 19039]GAK14236.1 phenylalanyl-tRNA synthetase alpha subunit [Geomicrobium sp. JCM 19039]